VKVCRGSDTFGLLLCTVADQVSVQELGAVVTIEAQQREGEPHAYPVYGFHDGPLASIGYGHTLVPASSDIDQAQGVDEFAADGASAVGHQINLQKTWPVVVPVAEGPDGDALLEASGSFGGTWASAWTSTPGFAELEDAAKPRSVHGGLAHLQQQSFGLLVEDQLLVALKDVDGLRQERVKPTGTDVVEYAPNADQGVDHALVVFARPFPRPPDPSRVTMSKQRDRILTVIPGSIDNRVENRAFLLLARFDVLGTQLLNQLPFGLAGHGLIFLHPMQSVG